MTNTTSIDNDDEADIIDNETNSRENSIHYSNDNSIHTNDEFEGEGERRLERMNASDAEDYLHEQEEDEDEGEDISEEMDILILKNNEIITRGDSANESILHQAYENPDILVNWEVFLILIIIICLYNVILLGLLHKLLLLQYNNY